MPKGSPRWSLKASTCGIIYRSLLSSLLSMIGLVQQRLRSCNKNEMWVLFLPGRAHRCTVMLSISTRTKEITTARAEQQTMQELITSDGR
jgi:hypothetical protein